MTFFLSMIKELRIYFCFGIPNLSQWKSWHVPPSKNFILTQPNGILSYTDLVPILFLILYL